MCVCACEGGTEVKTTCVLSSCLSIHVFMYVEYDSVSITIHLPTCLYSAEKKTSYTKKKLPLIYFFGLHIFLTYIIFSNLGLFYF